MLSLEDIKNVSFRRATFGGYRPEDVDAFIDDLQISYEKMLGEQERMKSDIEKLESQIQKYREEDSSIKSVILSAQRVAEKSLFDAKNKTSEIIKTAVESSKEMIEKAKKEVSLQNEISERIKAESAKLKSKLESIYKHHMDIIREIPGRNSGKDDSKRHDDEGSREICSEKTKLTAEEKVNKIIGEVVKNDDFLTMPKRSKEISGGVKNQNDEKKSDALNSRFKNLKFGENYDVTQLAENSGIYEGIFKKNK